MATKVTTFGDPVESHIDVINRMYDEYVKKISDVQEYLAFNDTFGLAHQTPRSRRSMVVAMTPYCKEGRSDLLVAEFGFVVFSVDEGVVEAVCGLVDPGYIPLGERSEVASVCEAKSLPFPKSHKMVGAKSYGSSQVLDLLKQMSDKHKLTFHNEIMMFATRGELGMITSCMAWLRRKANRLGDTSTKYTCRTLEMLLMKLSSEAEGKDEHGHKFSPQGTIEHEGGSARFIFNQRYDFEPILACNWHNKPANIGKIDQCAGNIALRRAYNCLFYLAHLLGFPLKAPAYLPPSNSQEARTIFGDGLREENAVQDEDADASDQGLRQRKDSASSSGTGTGRDEGTFSESSIESDGHDSSTDTTRGYSSSDY